MIINVIQPEAKPLFPIDQEVAQGLYQSMMVTPSIATPILQQPLPAENSIGIETRAVTPQLQVCPNLSVPEAMEEAAPDLGSAFDPNFFEQLETMEFATAEELANAIKSNPDTTPMPGMEKVAKVIAARLHYPDTTHPLFDDFQSLVNQYEKDPPANLDKWIHFIEEAEHYLNDHPFIHPRHFQVLKDLRQQAMRPGLDLPGWQDKMVDWLHLAYADLKIHKDLEGSPFGGEAVRQCYETLARELEALRQGGFPYRQSLLFSYKVAHIRGYLAWESAVNKQGNRPDRLLVYLQERERHFGGKDKPFYCAYHCEKGVESFMSLPWQSLFDDPEAFTKALRQVYAGLSIALYDGQDHFCVNHITLVPCTDDLDIHFFNKTYGLPFLPIGMNFYYQQIADNMVMTTGAFAHHDMLHASSQCLLGVPTEERPSRLRHNACIRALYEHKEQVSNLVDWNHLTLCVFAKGHEMPPYKLFKGSDLMKKDIVDEAMKELGEEFKLDKTILSKAQKWLDDYLQIVSAYDDLEEGIKFFFMPEKELIERARGNYQRLKSLNEAGLSAFFTQYSDHLKRFDCRHILGSLMMGLYFNKSLEQSKLNKRIYLFLIHDFDFDFDQYSRKTPFQEEECAYYKIVSSEHDNTPGHETRFCCNVYVTRGWYGQSSFDYELVYMEPPRKPNPFIELPLSECSPRGTKRQKLSAEPSYRPLTLSPPFSGTGSLPHPAGRT